MCKFKPFAMHHVTLLQGPKRRNVFSAHECFVWEEVWAVFRKGFVSTFLNCGTTAAWQKQEPGGREIQKNINLQKFAEILGKPLTSTTHSYFNLQGQGGRCLNYKSNAHSFQKVKKEREGGRQKKNNHS